MKINIRFVAFIAASVFSVSAQAQSTCQDFENAINGETKGIALIMAEGLGDNSAPRQTNRNTEINGKFQLININLQLQIQNKCPVRKTPINPMLYIAEALDCNLARLKDEKNSPACDMMNWNGLKK